MKNFARALRLALRYRLTLAGVVLSSVLVAVFWAANIGTIYPVVEVIFQGKSLRHWVDDEIAKAERRGKLAP